MVGRSLIRGGPAVGVYVVVGRYWSAVWIHVVLGVLGGVSVLAELRVLLCNKGLWVKGWILPFRPTMSFWVIR